MKTYLLVCIVFVLSVVFTACSQNSDNSLSSAPISEAEILWEHYTFESASNSLLKDLRQSYDLPVTLIDEGSRTIILFNEVVIFDETGGSSLGSNLTMPRVQGDWYDAGRRYFVIRTHFTEHGSIYGKSQLFVLDTQSRTFVELSEVPYTMLGVERYSDPYTLLVYSETGGYHSGGDKKITKINFLTREFKTYLVP